MIDVVFVYHVCTGANGVRTRLESAVGAAETELSGAPVGTFAVIRKVWPDTGRRVAPYGPGCDVTRLWCEWNDTIEQMGLEEHASPVHEPPCK